MARTVTLRWLASRRGDITPKELEQIEQWLDDDWESHDIDKDAVKLIRRLVATVKVLAS